MLREEAYVDVCVPFCENVLRHAFLSSFCRCALCGCALDATFQYTTLFYAQVLVVDGQTGLADLLERGERLRQTQVHVAMTEATLHSLLQAVRDVDTRGQAKNCYGRLPRLRNVKQVVQQCLTWVLCKEVKLIHDKYDSFGDLVGELASLLGGMR